jgi:hypothetical protein
LESRGEAPCGGLVISDGISIERPVVCVPILRRSLIITQLMIR